MDFDRNAAARLAEKYESFYLYDEQAILDSIERLRKSFDGVRLACAFYIPPRQIRTRAC